MDSLLLNIKNADYVGFINNISKFNINKDNGTNLFHIALREHMNIIREISNKEYGDTSNYAIFTLKYPSKFTILEKEKVDKLYNILLLRCLHLKRDYVQYIINNLYISFDMIKTFIYTGYIIGKIFKLLINKYPELFNIIHLIEYFKISKKNKDIELLKFILDTAQYVDIINTLNKNDTILRNYDYPFIIHTISYYDLFINNIINYIISKNNVNPIFINKLFTIIIYYKYIGNNISIFVEKYYFVPSFALQRKVIL